MELVFLFALVVSLIGGVIYIKDKIDEESKMPFDKDRLKSI